VLPEWLRDAEYFTANLAKLPADFDFREQARLTGISPHRKSLRQPRMGASHRPSALLRAAQFSGNASPPITLRKHADPSKIEFLRIIRITP